MADQEKKKLEFGECEHCFGIKFNDKDEDCLSCQHRLECVKQFHIACPPIREQTDILRKLRKISGIINRAIAKSTDVSADLDVDPLTKTIELLDDYVRTHKVEINRFLDERNNCDGDSSKPYEATIDYMDHLSGKKK